MTQAGRSRAGKVQWGHERRPAGLLPAALPPAPFPVAAGCSRLQEVEMPGGKKSWPVKQSAALAIARGETVAEAAAGAGCSERTLYDWLEDDMDFLGLLAHIQEELLGAVLDNRLGPAIRAAQQQLDLDIGDDTRCTIRHGFSDSPAQQSVSTYLLDYDAYRNEVAEFDPEDLKRIAATFNGSIWDLFTWSITSRLFDMLRGEPNG